MVPPVASTTTFGSAWAASGARTVPVTLPKATQSAISRRGESWFNILAPHVCLSAHGQKEPRRRDEGIPRKGDGGRQGAEAVELALGQVAAAGEQQVGARRLRRERREIVG